MSVCQLDYSWFKQSCGRFQAVCCIIAALCHSFPHQTSPHLQCSLMVKCRSLKSKHSYTLWTFVCSIFHYLKPNIKRKAKNILHWSQLGGSECLLYNNLVSHTLQPPLPPLNPIIHSAYGFQVLSNQRFLSLLNSNRSVLYCLSSIELGSLSSLVQFPNHHIYNHFSKNELMPPAGIKYPPTYLKEKQLNNIGKILIN